MVTGVDQTLLAVSIEKELGSTVRPEGIPDVVTAITPGGGFLETGLALMAYETESPAITSGLRVPGASRKKGNDELFCCCCACVIPPPPQAANVSEIRTTKAEKTLHAVHLGSLPMGSRFIGTPPHPRSRAVIRSKSPAF